MFHQGAAVVGDSGVMSKPVVVGKIPGEAGGEAFTTFVDEAAVKPLDMLDTSLKDVPVWSEYVLDEIVPAIFVVAVEPVKLPALTELDMLAIPVSVSSVAEV